MKNKMISLLGLLLLGLPSFAAEKPIDAQNRVYQNYLVNPGFENGSYGWTASGGATKTANSTAKAEGSYGYDWDSNSASQTLLQSVVIPAGLYGRNGVAYCLFKAASGTATHTLTVDDGTNNLVTAVTIASSTSVFQRTAVNFIYPSSGSVRIKMTSVASNEPEIYVDSCYLGEANNLSFVSQAQFIGSAYIANTSSCTWTRANTALGAFGTTSACPGPTVEYNPGPGTIQTTDTDLPKFTVNNLPPGNYEVKICGREGGTGASSLVTALAINDGTTTSGATAMQDVNNVQGHFCVIGFFSYSSAANQTFELYGNSNTNTINVYANSSNTSDALRFSILRFPTSTEQAYRSDQTPASWSGYHDSTCSWARTNTAYGDPTADTTCVLTERYNRNFGTVTSYLSGSDKLPGIVFTPNATGRYQVCAGFKWTAGTTTSQSAFKLFDQTNILDETEWQLSSSTLRASSRLCGIYNAATLAAATISIQSKVDTGSVTISTANTGSAIDWTVIALDSPFPHPISVGSITSNTSGSERVERALIAQGSNCSSSPCTITSQSGSWLSSVTRAGTGDYSLNIANGIFSAQPACVVLQWNANLQTIPTVSPQTSTLFRITTATSGGTATDTRDFNVICMGPR